MSTILDPIPVTHRAMRAEVASKLQSGSHWIFLPGLGGMPGLTQLERKFYRSTTREEWSLVDWGAFGIYIGTKKRLSPEALAAFLRSQPIEHVDSRPLTAIDLMQHDVIVLAHPEEAPILIENFYKWLGPLTSGPDPGVSFKIGN